MATDSMLVPMSSLSEAARRAMAEIGPVWGSDLAKHREIVYSTYTPLLERIPDTGLEATRNVAYGSHPRQVLDVYKPNAATARRS